MAGTSLDIQVRELDINAPLAVLQALDRRAVDLSDVMDEIGGALVTSATMRFERGTGPDGQSWTPSHRALQENGQTLVDHGRLRDSITHRAGRQSVKMGSNLIYAAIHQFGGTIKSKRPDGRHVAVESVTIPARPFLGIDENDESEMHDILADAIRAAAPGVEVVR